MSKGKVIELQADFLSIQSLSIPLNNIPFRGYVINASFGIISCPDWATYFFDHKEWRAYTGDSYHTISRKTVRECLLKRMPDDSSDITIADALRTEGIFIKDE